MITLPNGKICMNEQEAIQWLLDNYPIPFQCSANYAPNTEIGLGTIVNPTPAKVKVGSIIFFADSKVSTVIAVDANSFKCSEEYNDLVDDVVYVSNVQLNASGHLIVTLSNGEEINAGLIKQVTGFSINASQHLIVSYNDGSTTDLGAIFSGNVNIAGNFTADSIIENMVGYSGTITDNTPNFSITGVYMGAVKNGNKLTVALFAKVMRTDVMSPDYLDFKIRWQMPSAALANIIPYTFQGLPAGANGEITFVKDLNTTPVKLQYILLKYTSSLTLNIYGLNNLALNTEYLFRYEETFLLNDNLLP